MPSDPFPAAAGDNAVSGGAADLLHTVGVEALATDERAPLLIDQTILLANDDDAGNDDQTITDVTGISSAGAAVALNGNVIVYNLGDVFGDLAQGETVTDTITYTVSDGLGGAKTATATITIVGVNDRPIINRRPTHLNSPRMTTTS